MKKKELKTFWNNKQQRVLMMPLILRRTRTHSTHWSTKLLW